MGRGENQNPPPSSPLKRIRGPRTPPPPELKKKPASHAGVVGLGFVVGKHHHCLKASVGRRLAAGPHRWRLPVGRTDSVPMGL